VNILVFEYATSMGVKDPALTAEGQAMLNSITMDLKQFNTSFLISKNSVPIKSNHCNPIIIEDDLTEWIDNNISSYDFCLPIAPEEDFILYKLTRLIEKNGVEVIGSSSDAVYTCSDKYLTYQALKSEVPIIPTVKVFWDDIDKYAKKILTKHVVKPADGVSCSAVQVVDSPESFKKAAERVKDVTKLPYFLLQDWVEGDSVSVSLLTNGEKTIPLSLNKQNNSQENGIITYNGGAIPFNHPNGDKAKNIAKKAIESLDGVKGYVGVDMIIKDEVHLVEVNSRITTPYVALRQMLNFNLGEALVASIKGYLPSEVKLEGEIQFHKKDSLQLKVIN
jgi:predicted ATP-grasp superfamily ATP-dependent carboligase